MSPENVVSFGRVRPFGADAGGGIMRADKYLCNLFIFGPNSPIGFVDAWDPIVRGSITGWNRDFDAIE